MKKMKVYLLSVLLLMTLLLPVTVNAEERKDEWKQKGYAFAPMNLVLLETEFGEKTQTDDLKRRILIDKVQENFSTNLHFAQADLYFFTEDELVKKISAASGEDVAALAKTDPSRYKQLVKEGAAFYCQGVLKVRFSAYNDTVRHIPERLETYETTKQVHINKNITDSNGKNVTIDEWVSVPVTESRVVPEHDEVTSHAAVEFTLFDAKSDQPVWKMVDSRDAVDKDKDGMIDRILKRAAEHLVAVKKS